MSLARTSGCGRSLRRVRDDVGELRCGLGLLLLLAGLGAPPLALALHHGSLGHERKGWRFGLRLLVGLVFAGLVVLGRAGAGRRAIDEAPPDGPRDPLQPTQQA